MASQEAALQRSLQPAITAHKGQDLPTAAKHYGEVLAINPSLPAIHNNLAAVQLAQSPAIDVERGGWSGSPACLRTAIARPRSSRTPCHCAEVYHARCASDDCAH